MTLEACKHKINRRNRNFPDSQPARCVALWQAVLYQALVDLDRGCGGRKLTSKPSRVEFDEAGKFLFSTRKKWREHRHWVCLAAGVDPPAFEEAVGKRPNYLKWQKERLNK